MTEAEVVAQLLAGRDFKCPQCAYPLRNLPGNICPECGFVVTRSRLLFGVAYWKRPAFFVGITGIGLALLPAAYAGVVIVNPALTSGRMDRADNFNLFLLIVWAASLAKLGISWINWSGSMAAWPRWRHRLAAAACWMLPVAGCAIAWKMGVV